MERLLSHKITLLVNGFALDVNLINRKHIELQAPLSGPVGPTDNARVVVSIGGMPSFESCVRLPSGIRSGETTVFYSGEVRFVIPLDQVIG